MTERQSPGPGGAGLAWGHGVVASARRAHFSRAGAVVFGLQWSVWGGAGSLRPAGAGGSGARQMWVRGPPRRKLPKVRKFPLTRVLVADINTCVGPALPVVCGRGYFFA